MQRLTRPSRQCQVKITWLSQPSERAQQRIQCRCTLGINDQRSFARRCICCACHWMHEEAALRPSSKSCSHCFKWSGIALFLTIPFRPPSRPHCTFYLPLPEDALPAGGKETQVGLVHNVFWTEPKGKGLLYTHVRHVAHLTLTQPQNAFSLPL